MENNRKALGKGLDQLFNTEHFDFDQLEKDIVENASKNDIVEVNLNDIRSNPYQPRKYFDQASLEELAKSIKENGLLQPIIVKKSIKGYELVAGERRCRAAKIAGMTTISAIVRDFSDEEMMEIAILENIQREDLSSIEEAEAYYNIINKTSITQEELAKKIGKDRTHITNMIGLLRLPKEVQELVNNKKLSMSHARLLSKLSSEEEINMLANKVISENLSVRELEELCQGTNVKKAVNISRKPNVNSEFIVYQELLRDKLGTKVKIKDNRIEIPFSSRSELITILDSFDIDVEG